MHAWLHTKPEKATQTRFKSMLGRPEMPAISDYERDMIDLLFDIGPVVPMAMGGHAPITEQDIGWYRLNRRAILTTAECATIKELSCVYAQGLSEATDKLCPAPYRKADIDRDSVANGFLEWTEKLKSVGKVK